jgi:hypothetical protein
MVGHKASRSKGARSLAKAFYSELLTFPTSRTVPSNRPNRPNPLARMPFQPELATVREGAPSPCNGNVRLDRKTASRPALPANRRRGEAQGTLTRGSRPRVTGPEHEHDADHKKTALFYTLTGVRLRASAPVSALAFAFAAGFLRPVGNNACGHCHCGPSGTVRHVSRSRDNLTARLNSAGHNFRPQSHRFGDWIRDRTPI